MKGREIDPQSFLKVDAYAVNLYSAFFVIAYK